MLNYHMLLTIVHGHLDHSHTYGISDIVVALHQLPNQAITRTWRVITAVIEYVSVKSLYQF